MSELDAEGLQAAIHHHFSDKDLLRDALTHSSTGHANNYERLEFLGDRVLGLIIAQILYKKFSSESEGDLAKRLAALVQASMLAQIAHKLDLGRYIRLSDAERNAGGSMKENILADALEALIGALYLDAGLPVCNDLIERLWADNFYKTQAPPQHPKTALQEWAQAQGLPLPEYEIAGQSGPDHAPVFEIRLRVKGYKDVHAQGRSRQEAEKIAAANFIEKLENKS